MPAHTIFIDDSESPDPPANVLAALVVPNDRLARLADHGLGAPWKLVERLWIRDVSADSNDGVVRRPK